MLRKGTSSTSSSSMPVDLMRPICDRPTTDRRSMSSKRPKAFAKAVLIFPSSAPSGRFMSKMGRSPNSEFHDSVRLGIVSVTAIRLHVVHERRTALAGPVQIRRLACYLPIGGASSWASMIGSTARTICFRLGLCLSRFPDLAIEAVFALVSRTLQDLMKRSDAPACTHACPVAALVEPAGQAFTPSGPDAPSPLVVMMMIRWIRVRRGLPVRERDGNFSQARYRNSRPYSDSNRFSLIDTVFH